MFCLKQIKKDNPNTEIELYGYDDCTLNQRIETYLEATIKYCKDGSLEIKIRDISNEKTIKCNGKFFEHRLYIKYKVTGNYIIVLSKNVMGKLVQASSLYFNEVEKKWMEYDNQKTNLLDPKTNFSPFIKIIGFYNKAELERNLEKIEVVCE